MRASSPSRKQIARNRSRHCRGYEVRPWYLSPYFITNAEKMTAELEDVYVLLHEKKLSGLQAMLPVLEAVVQSGKPLLIIAEDVEASAGHAGRQSSARRPEGRRRQGPGFGDRRKAMLEDIAILTAVS